MPENDQSKFINKLQIALQKERVSKRIYQDLARHETNEARSKVLLSLAEAESGHEERWSNRLRELGANIPSDREKFSERIWRWILVQSGTENAIKRIENNEYDDVEMYKDMIEIAPSETDRQAIKAVLHDEELHMAA